ncbi:hypothetical protein NPIL_133991, partial [Nephila pilipes]
MIKGPDSSGLFVGKKKRTLYPTLRIRGTTFGKYLPNPFVHGTIKIGSLPIALS